MPLRTNGGRPSSTGNFLCFVGFFRYQEGLTVVAKSNNCVRLPGGVCQNVSLRRMVALVMSTDSSSFCFSLVYTVTLFLGLILTCLTVADLALFSSILEPSWLSLLFFFPDILMFIPLLSHLSSPFIIIILVPFIVPLSITLLMCGVRSGLTPGWF